ncbi:MAG: hypothetical protein J6U92_08030 [Clostridia bacterium]|nr:hypothetical protein [Clostridia bacterium]
MVKVFYATINGVALNENLISALPTVRKEYVSTIKDPFRKAQSVLVWCLLQEVLKKEFGFNDSLDFIQNNGEWSALNGGIEFSLSHSNNVVAVAVSNNRVGVDVELCSSKVLKVKKMFQIDTQAIDEIEQLTLLWTQKESAYKSKINGNLFSKTLLIDGEKYVVTVNAIDNDVEFKFIDIQNLLKGD